MWCRTKRDGRHLSSKPHYSLHLQAIENCYQSTIPRVCTIRLVWFAAFLSITFVCQWSKFRKEALWKVPVSERAKWSQRIMNYEDVQRIVLRLNTVLYQMQKILKKVPLASKNTPWNNNNQLGLMGILRVEETYKKIRIKIIYTAILISNKQRLLSSDCTARMSKDVYIIFTHWAHNAESQWISVDSTSRRWINIYSMLIQRCVPAGSLVVKYFKRNGHWFWTNLSCIVFLTILVKLLYRSQIEIRNSLNVPGATWWNCV